MMKVSVIVPFLNEESYIGQCIEALVHQDFPKAEYELIFVDNGSVDRSAELVRRHPEILCLREPKRSAYAARNHGLAAASGDVIAFTDADCVPTQDWLRQIIEGIARTSAVVVLGQLRFPHRNRGSLRLIEEYENAKLEYLLSRCPLRHLLAFTGNMAITKDVARAVGPFAEWRRGADIDYLHRCLARFGPACVAYLEEMTVTHLEVTGVGRWLSKQMTYGWAFNRIARETPYRRLGHRRKFEAYRHCTRVHAYAFGRQWLLLGLLASGVFCFEMGRFGGGLGIGGKP